MTAVERVISRLSGVRRVREGEFRANCPNCGGDSGTKFSVTQTDNGVVVHCFGGCPLESILAALCMRSARELFDAVQISEPNQTRHEVRLLSEQRERQARIERGLRIWTQRRLIDVCQSLRRVEESISAFAQVVTDLENEGTAEIFRKLYWQRSELECEWHVLVSGDLQRIYDEIYRRLK